MFEAEGGEKGAEGIDGAVVEDGATDSRLVDGEHHSASTRLGHGWWLLLVSGARPGQPWPEDGRKERMRRKEEEEGHISHFTCTKMAKKRKSMLKPENGKKRGRGKEICVILSITMNFVVFYQVTN